MSNETPVRDFILPRVTALIAETEGQGIEKAVAVAVLIDIVTSPQFDAAAPSPLADSAPHRDWDRSASDPVLVNGTTPVSPQTVGVQAEDDFIAPLTIRD